MTYLLIVMPVEVKHYLNIMPSPGIILAIALILVHIFAPKLTAVSQIPRFRWTSFAGGVCLSYVFLKIFPDLGYTQAELQYTGVFSMQYLKHQVYLLALSGLLVFYRLDLWVYRIKSTQAVFSSPKNQHHPASFWIHLGAFALTNGITGYLLQDLSSQSIQAGILFFISLALYCLIIDDKLHQHQPSLYDRQGRWLLIAATVSGAVIGQVTQLNQVAIAIVWSFLAGTIILNVLKRELPDERESCFDSFMAGTIFFTVLLLLT